MIHREDLGQGTACCRPLLIRLWLVCGVNICEMPGLRLTVSQACRLWHVDVSTCEMLFEALLREGFLYKTGTGAYIAQPTIRKRI
jgi:hypothetical protein